SRCREAVESPAKEVGIFPSSFNPITEGHMAILREAPKIRAFQEIMLVLDTQAMDKEILGATLVDRLLMLQLLFEDHPRFSIGVSNRGLFLPKAEVLKEMYPKDTNRTFLMGYDTLARVFDPRYYEDRDGALDRLFESCTFMVANRGDCGREAIQRLMASGATRRFMGKVLFCQIPYHLAQISSNRVRQRVREGKAFARLVPAEVREFIEKVKLYKADREVGPQGQRVNFYDLRTQVLCRLSGLYPEGRVKIDIGEIVDTVVERLKRGWMIETLLNSLPRYIPGEKKSDGIEDNL
ncbi:MAG: nicotinate-nicotinamide nucleotide adenylyltransferase, partial [Thermodesulfobacteriota bacterium]